MNNLDNIRFVDVPCYPDRQGLLVAYNEISDFGIDIRRVFVVAGHANSMRGKHAHKALTQILICVQGTCCVVCDDGTQRREFILDQANRALILPNGIWSEQFYVEEGTVLVVLCDLQYDESDYIRDYESYLAFRKRGVA
ncbi:FdtA/QdtA family cupin domain-containing protein [Polynucleobacter sp. MWH-Braz-FAM2G]|uniref:sugar 3,4-ketoisomerase n=1 Tax=Polynucleobacter sp. MWH-Braz-FAM2G TaxID=1855883 RepID=UPI001BFE544F|nr:FdtA/QdtA family cupin domain-containing protein [Polynucleobacter sp. MWH-Braz-FAM2G]QWD91092.1 FdtA/QdtA family cupin domain-containing protein [Polynucleobacter sp. MWH-Braz-FAM2G]